MTTLGVDDIAAQMVPDVAMGTATANTNPEVGHDNNKLEWTPINPVGATELSMGNEDKEPMAPNTAQMKLISPEDEMGL